MFAFRISRAFATTHDVWRARLGSCPHGCAAAWLMPATSGSTGRHGRRCSWGDAPCALRQRSSLLGVRLRAAAGRRSSAARTRGADTVAREWKLLDPTIYLLFVKSKPPTREQQVADDKYHGAELEPSRSARASTRPCSRGRATNWRKWWYGARSVRWRCTARRSSRAPPSLGPRSTGDPCGGRGVQACHTCASTSRTCSLQASAKIGFEDPIRTP